LVDNAPRAGLPQGVPGCACDRQGGDVIGPLTVGTTACANEVFILVLRGVREEGEYTFEEVRDQLRSSVAEEKGVRRYLNGLRQKTYVSIRM